MKARYGMADWGTLVALSVLWGSAFLFTKIAVESIPPPHVVAGRLAIAAMLLVPLALALARRPKGGRRLWIFMLLIALFGNVLPFTLITWGQKFIDSGLAGILMAVMPLATLSLAHFLVPGERLTRYRITGFALGFSGVVVIMGPESFVSLLDGGGQVLPMLAVLGGAVCYAVAAILARLRPPSDALFTSATTMLLATLMIAPVAFDAGSFRADLASSSLSLASVAVLGIFSTALAAILYFRLVKIAGPSFVSQLNYLIPLWAVLMGVVFLDEHPEAKHLLALCLILGGVLMAQLENRGSRESRRWPGSGSSSPRPASPPS